MKCIYCDQEFDSENYQGDHILPSKVFGEFREDRRLKPICKRCNSEIGEAEGQLKSCGPEGLLRIMCFSEIDPKAIGEYPLRPIKGAPAPVIKIDDPECGIVLYEYYDEGKFKRADQLIIEDSDEKRHYIRIIPDMHPKHFIKEWESLDITGEPKLASVCDMCFTEMLSGLLETIGKNIEDVQLLEQDERILIGKPEFVVNDNYFRAIVKIAFHYYLVFGNNLDHASDTGFDGIRHFILNGGDHSQYIKESNGFLAPEFENAIPNHWCHLLAAHEENGNVMVYLRLFWNKEHFSKKYYINLGRISRPLILPVNSYSHLYSYDKIVAKGKKVGQVYKSLDKIYF